MYNLTRKELKILRKLNTPKKIQDFLNKLEINFEPDGDTCISPRAVLKTGKCHCIEGAMLAALAFKLQGKKALVVDLTATQSDFDHVVAVFRENGKWGAVSKTNHAVLRYREPVYRDIRELVMSFFHEYFTDSGKKTLRSYSMPIDLIEKFGVEWITKEENLWEIPEYLASCRHYKVLNKKQIKNLRRADKIEIEAGKLVEFKKD
ncbi:MAG: hypothetical protein KKB21_05235 [Nanoarchaeota archaeon]|nr:hypothetical protein [Nanoarchaeota archaeon]MBU4086950.1 hypothetical protein [Nanoarchaeota archaeon]